MSVLMVGLRGVGKTVLLDRMRREAEQIGISAIMFEAPEASQAFDPGLRPDVTPHRHDSCSL